MDETTCSYRASILALTVSIGEHAVMLDLHAQEFLGLNTISTEMWKLLVEEGKTPQEVVRAIVERYEADAEGVKEDLADFMATMQRRHLLTNCQQESGTPRHPWPSSRQGALLEYLLDTISLFNGGKVFRTWAVTAWLEASLSLRCVDWWLKRRGLQALGQRLQQLPASTRVDRTDAEVLQLASIMASAANWSSFRAACLHQYLALCWMLRKRGRQADCVIGVTLYPFFAHAWLKSGPHAIQDALHWRSGLGLDKSIEQLQALSLLFVTDDTTRSGESEER